MILSAFVHIWHLYYKYHILIILTINLFIFTRNCSRRKKMAYWHKCANKSLPHIQCQTFRQCHLKGRICKSTNWLQNSNKTK